MVSPEGVKSRGGGARRRIQRHVPCDAMGWGYRKRVKLLPGINLNIGKRGVGVSGGRRGARVSASPSGRRSLSLALKGFFWRRKL